MLHPTFWPKKCFFYPIGNTPPLCLTEHLPPEENAEILLLGCGDPRNILYTITVDHSAHDRRMDITCCDWEPAIIARNILLFTFIADSVENTQLPFYWSIFYDLFLDKQCASLLNDQCTKLVSHAKDMTTWESSPYGRFLKFTTQDSLAETRHHWGLYTETIGLSAATQKQLKQVFTLGLREKMVRGTDTPSIIAAVPLSSQFPTSLNTYTQYWRTGVTSSPANPNIGTQINPTFLFSMMGRRFNLHYGTDPCSSFHLALGLAKLTYDGFRISTPVKTECEMWEACRSQFSRWCIAFHSRLEIFPERTLILRFAIGDALAFCDGLRLCQAGDFTPSIYSSAWGTRKFEFHDRSAPTSFNVIDTSNLSDHLGLLNILVATLPLLQRSPFTTLNTNSLLPYDNDPKQRNGIEERALLDLPSLALFLGITPICYASGLTFINGPKTSRSYERISWRFCDFTHAEWKGTFAQRYHQICFEPLELADKLFSVYLIMFEDENIGARLKNLHLAGNDLTKMLSSTHYHRTSFVLFLSAAKRNITTTSWCETMRFFLDRVMTDRSLLVGPNNFQDLLANLHMHGIHSQEILMPGFIENTFGRNLPPFNMWDSTPPVVCVVLKVPRRALKVLEDIHEEQVGHPIFQCETFSSVFHNVHSSLRPVFGDIVPAPGPGRRSTIREDVQGLGGYSPLIVSFYVPSWFLVRDPGSVEIGLCIKSTPKDSGRFASKLGPGLRLYSAKLLDQNHVFIFPERPDNEGELERFASINPSRPSSDTEYGIVTVSLGRGAGCERLSKRLDIKSPEAKETLTNKALVRVAQVTPFCMEVVFGDHRYALYYPIPVDGTRSRTRIARKSFYIEVDVPYRTSPLTQVTLQPFPFVLGNKHGLFQTVCWNSPYLSLDRLPVVSVSDNPKWIAIYLGGTLSCHERGFRGSLPRDPSINFRMSICAIMLKYVNEGIRIYILKDPGSPSAHAIILLSGIRIDLSSGTIVGDATVIFPSPSITPLIARHLGRGSTAVINTPGEEVRMWKHALPAFAERCRQWQHLPTCEYFERDRVPLSLEPIENPLCSCGKGKNLGLFSKNECWKDLTPHTTRIALSPMFPVTYLEDTITGFPAGEFAHPGGNRCKRCGEAGKPKLLICSACQLLKYCSKDCQIADWKRHKVLCKKLERK